ncbi:MAG: MFS transporter [Spirochaetales bacterium]|nr:MFS transporter [Candidatus Physcosoma equi]
MKKNLRGWLIAIAGTLVMATVYGGVINCNTLFVVPVSRELGIPRQSYSLTLTLMFLCYMVSSMLSGKMFKKFGLKTCMTMGAVFVPLLFFSNGFAPSLFVLYLDSVLIGLLLPFISFTAFSVVIKDWFQENSGLAIGISFMGSGIGGRIWSFLLGIWLDSIGYRASYRMMAIIMAVFTIPVVLFLVKPNQKNFGVLEGEKLSFSETLKDRQTLLVLLISFLVGITPVIISQSLVPNAQDNGFSIQYASMLNAFFMGGLCLMKLVVGRLFDTAGLKKTLVLTLVAGVISLICAILVSIKMLHPIYIFFLALNGTIQSMAPSIIAMNYSTKENFPTANGLAVGINYLGCALAPFILNGVYDAMGSYSPVLYCDLVATAFAILIVLVAKKPKTAN